MTTENLKKFAAATNNELFDADYKGGEWMVEAVETQETLEQWEESSKGWNERTAMMTGTKNYPPYTKDWSSASYRWHSNCYACAFNIPRNNSISLAFQPSP